jgi:hypothetical protein
MANNSSKCQHNTGVGRYAKADTFVVGTYFSFLLVRMVSQLAGEEDMASRVRDILSISVQPDPYRDSITERSDIERKSAENLPTDCLNSFWTIEEVFRNRPNFAGSASEILITVRAEINFL